MSIADKQVFLKDFERTAGSILTVTKLEEVMKLLVEQLDSYDVTMESDDSNGDIDLLEVFLEAKQIEGKSVKTIQRYREVLSLAFRKINVPIRKITVYHLRNYLKGMKDKGNMDSSINGIRDILHSYFGWLKRENLIEIDPCANLSSVKCPKKVRLPYSAVEIERIKEACRNDRDRAIVHFLLATGCRIGEVCELDRDSVDFHSMEIIVHGKGNKERTVYMDSITSMMLKRYLDSRTDSHKALFVSRTHERLTPHGFRYALRILEKRSGVENVHPHRFRRTLATNLIDRGMPIQEVAAILGHDKIDTTLKYVYINKANVKNAYHKCA